MSRSMKRAFAIIGGFFILLWVSIAYTLTLAFRHFEPVMDPNYSIRQAHLPPQPVEQSRSAWALSSPLFEQERISRGTLVIPIRLASRTGAIVPAGTLEVRCERPATTVGGSFQTIPLENVQQGKPGEYEVAVPIPSPGFWEVSVIAKIKDGEPVYLRHRFVAQ